MTNGIKIHIAVSLLALLILFVGYAMGRRESHKDCNYPPAYKKMYEAYMKETPVNSAHLVITDGRTEVQMVLLPTDVENPDSTYAEAFAFLSTFMDRGDYSKYRYKMFKCVFPFTKKDENDEKF